MVENRTNKRRRCYLGGRVIFENRLKTISCTVRNISEFGAKLEFGACPIVPDSLELLLDSEAAYAPAHVVWRNQNFVGIAFKDSQIRNGKAGVALSMLLDVMPIQSHRTH
jgi:hypothetical protein